MIVGMDFGTTNSGMSVFDGQQLRLIPLDHTNANPHVARTALYITNQRRVYLGREAVETYYEQNINREVKYERVWVGEITLTFAELPEFVRDVSVEKDILSPGRLFLSFKTSLRSPTYVGTVVGTQFYFLEDIVALYLYAMKQRAEAFLRTDLKQIVLGRPVHFADSPQHDRLAEQRLVDAAFRAGYEDVYLQYEPIAAAHFYETTIAHPQNVLIFDFGGGTLDITIARLGGSDPREILATGGVPVAGDVFDQKLVRSVLPHHFGEGSYFISSNDQRLPVPASFYEAFTDWQEMLELNKPDMLLILNDIARTADQRQQINSLIRLIKSSYSLKMFDAAEAAKRDLSRRIVSMLTLQGDGFNISEALTRDEFELLIADEAQRIADALDATVRQAGLTNDDIDAVIRTGGSAQIPAFIQMLDARFGPEKVRAIDTFRSVTSGLGILGHFQETGAVDLRAYHRREWSSGARVRQNGNSAAPVVDLDLMKRFIDLGERGESSGDQQRVLLAINRDSYVAATTQPNTAFSDDTIALTDLGIDVTPGDHVASGSPSDRVLVITSEYRFFLRTLQQLADVAAIGLSLAEIESFFADQFGRETISTLADWRALQAAERVILVSSKGKAKIMPAHMLLPNFTPTHPYQLEHLSGTPIALLPATTGELLLITNAGAVTRLQPNSLPTGEQTLIRLRKDERVTAAYSLPHPAELLLATHKGRGKRIHTRALPFAKRAETSTITLAGRDLVASAIRQPEAPLRAVTTHGLRTVAFDTLPLDNPTPPQKRAWLKLKRGEELVALRYLR